MNIFIVKIDDLEFLVEIETNYYLDAIIEVFQHIKDDPADLDLQEEIDANEINIHVKLVGQNVTMEEFELNHPEDFGEYF